MKLAPQFTLPHQKNKHLNTNYMICLSLKMWFSHGWDRGTDNVKQLDLQDFRATALWVHQKKQKNNWGQGDFKGHPRSKNLLFGKWQHFNLPSSCNIYIQLEHKIKASKIKPSTYFSTKPTESVSLNIPNMHQTGGPDWWI